jgi:formate dehydrogenase subunit delta
MLVVPEIRLANDIAAQFRHLPQEQGAKEVARHITSFWDPRMRTRLLECVAEGSDGLDPLVVGAAGLLR